MIWITDHLFWRILICGLTIILFKSCPLLVQGNREVSSTWVCKKLKMRTILINVLRVLRNLSRTTPIRWNQLLENEFPIISDECQKMFQTKNTIDRIQHKNGALHFSDIYPRDVIKWEFKITIYTYVVTQTVLVKVLTLEFWRRKIPGTGIVADAVNLICSKKHVSGGNLFI